MYFRSLVYSWYQFVDTKEKRCFLGFLCHGMPQRRRHLLHLLAFTEGNAEMSRVEIVDHEP